MDASTIATEALNDYLNTKPLNKHILVMKNGITDNEKLAFDYLRVLLGVVGGGRELYLIMRAIMYADPLEYFHEPKSKEEVVRREIFLTRARSYWNRKMLDFNSDNYKTINEIQNWEQHEVTRLKMQLPLNNKTPY